MRADEIREAMKTAESMETNDDSMRRPIELPTNHSAEPRHETNAEVDGAKYWEEFFTGTKKLMDTVFDKFPEASSKDRSLLNELFATKDYESHSPLLRKYAEAGHVPSGETLSERTRDLLPR